MAHDLEPVFPHFVEAFFFLFELCLFFFKLFYFFGQFPLGNFKLFAVLSEGVRGLFGLGLKGFDFFIEG